MPIIGVDVGVGADAAALDVSAGADAESGALAAVDDAAVATPTCAVEMGCASDAAAAVWVIGFDPPPQAARKAESAVTAAILQRYPGR